MVILWWNWAFILKSVHFSEKSTCKCLKIVSTNYTVSNFNDHITVKHDYVWLAVFKEMLIFCHPQASLSGHAPKDQAYAQILEHVYNQLRNTQWPEQFTSVHLCYAVELLTWDLPPCALPSVHCYTVYEMPSWRIYHICFRPNCCL